MAVFSGGTDCVKGQRCEHAGGIWSESHGGLLTSEEWLWLTLQRQKWRDRESVSELWQMSAQFKSSPSGTCPTSAFWTTWGEKSTYELLASQCGCMCARVCVWVGGGHGTKFWRHVLPPIPPLFPAWPSQMLISHVEFITGSHHTHTHFTTTHTLFILPFFLFSPS